MLLYKCMKKISYILSTLIFPVWTFYKNLSIQINKSVQHTITQTYITLTQYPTLWERTLYHTVSYSFEKVSPHPFKDC